MNFTLLFSKKHFGYISQPDIPEGLLKHEPAAPSQWCSSAEPPSTEKAAFYLIIFTSYSRAVESASQWILYIFCP